MFATILVSVLACTQMESPGNPFSSVQIAEEKTETKQAEVTEKKQEKDPLFEPVGSVVMVSEVDEKTEVGEVTSNEKEEQPTEDSSNVVVEEIQPAIESSEKIEDTKIESEQKVNMSKQEVKSLGQWPLRVVKTEAGLNPPRAILGLPSGEEVVIRPGMQLPEENLVVMSIGSKAVVLARVHAQGDHAQIEHLTLPSLND